MSEQVDHLKSTLHEKLLESSEIVEELESALQTKQQEVRNLVLAIVQQEVRSQNARTCTW